MAYTYTNSKGRTYFLQSKIVTHENGRQQTLYYFARDKREDTLDAVPDGYEVFETKNGLPVLTRSK